MSYSVISHVGTGGSGGNTVTSNSINTTGADLIVLYVAWYGTSGGVMDATKISDSKSNTYTARPNHGFTAQGNARIFYCHSPTVGTGHTFTATDNNTFPAIFALALSGSTSVPFDVDNGSLTNVPGSITPTANNEIVITGVYDLNTSSPATIDSGMTISDSVLYSAGVVIGGSMAYKIQTTATAISPTWTGTSITASAIASFKGTAPTSTVATPGSTLLWV